VAIARVPRDEHPSLFAPAWLQGADLRRARPLHRHGNRLTATFTFRQRVPLSQKIDYQAGDSIEAETELPVRRGREISGGLAVVDHPVDEHMTRRLGVGGQPNTVGRQRT
jgi:hypothetical protein